MSAAGGGEWMSLPDAAVYLGVTARTAHVLAQQPDAFPMYRLGRVFRVRKVDLDAYLERCRVVFS